MIESTAPVNRDDDYEEIKGVSSCMIENEPETETHPNKVPLALEPPIPLEINDHQLEIWEGQATLCLDPVQEVREKSGQEVGNGRIFFDFRPTPMFKFEFTQKNERKLRPSDIIGSYSRRNGVIECGPPVGAIQCQTMLITNDIMGRGCEGSLGELITGGAESPIYHSAQFLVINGPIVYGDRVKRHLGENYGIYYRMSAKIEDAEIIMDSLSSNEQSHQTSNKFTPYKFTHVVQCTFSEAVSFSRINQLRTNLFRLLSLMQCRWVGLLGPWLQSAEATDTNFRVSVTKTMRNGGTVSWCHESMSDCFSDGFGLR